MEDIKLYIRAIAILTLAVFALRKLICTKPPRLIGMGSPAPAPVVQDREKAVKNKIFVMAIIFWLAGILVIVYKHVTEYGVW